MPKSQKTDRPLKYHWYKTEIDRLRHRWFVRSRAQAEFRGEDWQLTYEDFCEFWPDEQTMNRRGRTPDSLCLTRYDPQGPWSRSNTIQLTRYQQLCVKNRRQYDLPCEEYLEDVKWI